MQENQQTRVHKTQRRAAVKLQHDRTNWQHWKQQFDEQTQMIERTTHQTSQDGQKPTQETKCTEMF
jgi:hypothetical protein